MNSPKDLLRKFWKFENFKAPQFEIIQTVLEKKNVITLLPTSAGKSVCFQIPAMVNEGICIVISPLIALMNDQVDSLNKKGIKSIALTSKYNYSDTITAFDNLRFGNFKFLYLSPEKLQTELIQEKIKQLNVNLIAIDEAHCISEWGHDFRPSYLKINLLHELLPDTKMIALTATATPKVLDDIKNQLNINDAILFKKSFYRENINYNIFKTEDVLSRLKDLLLKHNESIIVYVNTRKSCQNIAAYLNKNNFKASYYHGGLDVEQKNQSFEDWSNEITPIIVATNAFGMGIDKDNVRAVIHLNIPNSIENYIQETGRSGRDRKPSYAYLLYNASTVFDFKNTIKKGLATPKVCKNVYIKLNTFYQISPGEKPEIVYDFNLQKFCTEYNLPIFQTFNVLTLLESHGVLEFQKNVSQKSSLSFTVSNKELFYYQDRNPNSKKIIQLLLRTYGGIFDKLVNINEYFLAKKLQLQKSELIKSLKQFQQDNIIQYNYFKGDSKILFLVPREDNFVINSISKNINKQNDIKIEKAKSIIDFIENDSVCRVIQLRTYFGEKSENTKCNNCDVCLFSKKEKPSYETIAKEILKLFQEDKQLNSKEITSLLNYDSNEVIITLKLLLDKKTLILDLQNKFKKA